MERLFALALTFLLSGCMSNSDPWFIGAGAVEDMKGGDPLARYRKILIGPDPELDGSSKQKLAINALVHGNSPEAHEVVKETLISYPQPGRASAATVRRILEMLTDQLALDLELKRVSLFELRMEIYEGYIPTLIELVMLEDSKKEGFDPLLFLFFAYLPPDTGRPTLRALLSDDEPDKLRATILLSGETKDPLLAKHIAPFLEKSEFKLLAQEAIAKLTLRAKPFNSLQEFEVWEQKNRRKTYDELARQEALKALGLEKLYEELRQKNEERFRHQVLLLVTKLIELSESVSPPPWSTFYDILTDENMREDRAAIVETLYQGFRKQSFDRGAIRNSMTDLQRLFAVLYRGYEQAPAAERRSWLSGYVLVAQLIGGDVQRTAEGTLLALLGKDDPDLDGRIVELMTLFPRDKIRERLLAHLEKSLELGNYASLPIGIRALGELRLANDPKLAGHTLSFFERCVRYEDLPAETREQAIEILGGLDHAKVVPTLRGVVNPGLGGLPEPLRLKSLAWVNQLVTTQLQAASSDDLGRLATDQLAFLLACLSDKSSRLRKDAAKELESFPPSPTSFKTTELRKMALEIVNEIGRALRRERISSAIQQYREVLRRQSSKTDVAWDALQQIALALESWSKLRDKQPDEAKRLLSEHGPDFEVSLRQLLGGKGVEVPGTLGLAEKLVRVGLHDQGLILLTSPVLMSLEGEVPGGASPEERARARIFVEMRKRRAELIVLVVEGHGDFDRLSVDDRKKLHEVVIKSSGGLHAISREKATSLMILGRAYLETKQPQLADKVLLEFLQGPGLEVSVELQTKARRLRAEALMDSGRPAQAANLLRGLKDFESRLLRAEALFLATKLVEAEMLYRDLDYDPSLPREGLLREKILVGIAACLLERKEIDEFDSFVESMPIEIRHEQTKQLMRELKGKRKNLK